MIKIPEITWDMMGAGGGDDCSNSIWHQGIQRKGQ